MKKEEAVEILQTINEMYLRFKLTKRKARMLIPNLMKMDYSGVLKNLSQYTMDHPSPSTISEIAAYPDEGDIFFIEIEKWQEEAMQVASEDRENFKKQFVQLIEHMKV